MCIICIWQEIGYMYCVGFNLFHYLTDTTSIFAGDMVRTTSGKETCKKICLLSKVWWWEMDKSVVPGKWIHFIDN